MPGHHVLCYSRADAQDLATRLAAALRAGSPQVQIELTACDRDDCGDARNADLIRDCAGLIVLVSSASAAENVTCAKIWAFALRYNKPIIPVLLHASAALPSQLESRRPIDVTAAFDRGCAQLRARIQQISTPKGRLQTLKERLSDAERDLRHEQEPLRQARIRDEIALLKEQIQQQQRVAENPDRAARRAGIDIERQIERERYTKPQIMSSEEESPVSEASARTPSAVEALLRSLDTDGKLGLQDTPDDLLAQAQQHTGGAPHAIEALFAILAADRRASLPELLNEISALPPAAASDWLVSEAFSRLDPDTQRVAQALAIYNQPVTANAVDYLLLPYLPGTKSEPMLQWLHALRLAQQQGDRFTVQPWLRDVALRQIPADAPTEQSAKGPARFSRTAVIQRGAEYFKLTRLPEKHWHSLDDLRPQLAEFELRAAGEEYDAAASLILMISHVLSAWGEHRLLIDLNKRLQDKLTDRRLALLVSDQLAAAYQAVGEFEAALSYHHRSLALAREHTDRAGEGISLGNLGQYWLMLGQPIRAMEHLQQALSIARETKDQHATQSRLLGLGLCAKEIGATHQAIDYDEQALSIARRLGDKGSESVILGNLGLCYGDLGESGKALDYLNEAQAAARIAGARASEGTTLVNQAIILIDEERYEEATQHLQHSTQIAHEVSSPRLAGFSSRFQALALLFTGDRASAGVAAEAALLHRSPEHTHTVLALRGVIALLQGHFEEAGARLIAAIEESDALLKHTPKLFKALDSKALALSGLALLHGEQHIPIAIAAYRAARATNRDAGIVRRVLRLLDTLAAGDEARVLSEVRAAAAGE